MHIVHQLTFYGWQICKCKFKRFALPAIYSVPLLLAGIFSVDWLTISLYDLLQGSHTSVWYENIENKYHVSRSKDLADI